ncbi:hypothetical protein RQP46_004039 [Phenoliferia psychrophenolica]
MMVNGTLAPLFGVTKTTKRTIGYIESSSAATFSIHFQDDQVRPKYGLIGDVFADGKSTLPQFKKFWVLSEG